MITDIDKYVDLLCENAITEHQFLILWLVHTKDETNIKKYKSRFGDFNVSQILDLIDRGLLDDFGTIKDGKQQINIYNFIVTDKFTKVVIIDEEDAYEELVIVFPKWFNIKGQNFSTRNSDPYKNAKEYKRYHKNNRLAHERVLRITKSYYSSNPTNISIEKYILNRIWNDIEDTLSGGKADSFKVL